LYTFKCDLQYVYMGVIPKRITAELGLELLDLARQYWLRAYEDHVVVALEQSLTAENVLTILGAAMLYDLTHLESICWDFIDVHIQDIISAKNFGDLDIPTLCKVVKRDSLCISEADLCLGLVL